MCRRWKPTIDANPRLGDKPAKWMRNHYGANLRDVSTVSGSQFAERARGGVI
jgi:hypothetical protein